MDWYYAKENNQVGPFKETDFIELIRKGEVTTDTLVWNLDLKDWQILETILDRYPQLKNTDVEETPNGTTPEVIHSCAECNRPFPESEMMHYEQHWVCADCKSTFVQRLKEGLQPQNALNYGGFWIRAGAKFIDGIILWFVNILIGMGAGGMLTLAEDAEYAMTSSLILSAFQIFAGAAYTTFFLGRYGATVGKMACGLKVVMPDKTPISYARALGRHFSEILSSIILCIGYLMAAFDPEKRTLHDRICNTRVVKR